MRLLPFLVSLPQARLGQLGACGNVRTDINVNAWHFSSLNLLN